MDNRNRKAELYKVYELLLQRWCSKDYRIVKNDTRNIYKFTVYYNDLAKAECKTINEIKFFVIGMLQAIMGYSQWSVERRVSEILDQDICRLLTEWN
jgi:hypothetical protein